eukprot:Skav207992  [mRNA]  locus=scaffold1203:86129:99281:+ [translate_table: standard]
MAQPGGPGVAYALLRRARLGGDDGSVELARRCLEPWRTRVAQQARKHRDLGCSLLCGQAGVLLVDALLQRQRGEAWQPGAVLLFCKAYETLREEQWLTLAKEQRPATGSPQQRNGVQEAGEVVWKYGLLKKGGQHHWDSTLPGPPVAGARAPLRAAHVLGGGAERVAEPGQSAVSQVERHRARRQGGPPVVERK